MPRRPPVIALVLLAVAFAGCGEDRRSDLPSRRPAADAPPSLPGPDAPLVRSARPLADDLVATRTALYGAINRWRTDGDPRHGGPPHAVALLALHEQRIYRLLGGSPRLARGVLAALPAWLRAEARDNVLAREELGRIRSVRRGPPPKIAIGPAEPADMLRTYYAAARRRFHVRPALLAAVNFVESAFGRLRNHSISGARGPMQFMPATWAGYGLGGDIADPHDAILGAANYLHANGAPGDELGALYHYNPSPHYVSAVARYARRIRRDWRRYYAYYAWAVFQGDRRLTGPGH
jgi:soluble lytic murein transglycosylase-like protein